MVTKKQRWLGQLYKADMSKILSNTQKKKLYTLNQKIKNLYMLR
jgi:hypothetical protein